MSDELLRAAVAAIDARGPGNMVPDLDRITDLCELLGDPQHSFQVVHLTGTNGKTSTAAMIASLIQAAGLVPGRYTSPHLQDVRERIRVAGALIEPEDLARHVAYLQPFLEVVDARHDVPVTYFETLTALAFLHFADAPIDVGVIEVGMGGRWDATNVVDARVAVLLQVTEDHAELGDSLVEIATEKVGIITEGSQVVSAAQDPGVAEVIATAVAANDGALKVYGRDFELLGRTQAVGGQLVDLQGVRGDYHEVVLPLFGAHQARNAAMALAAFEAYFRFEVEIDEDLLREGLAAARSPGRLEPVPRGDDALIVLDGAHNPAGAAALATALLQEFAFQRRVGIVGILDDKDVEAMVAALAPALDHVVVVAPDVPRAADPARIEAACHVAGLSVEVAGDAEQAIDLASGVTRPGDGIIVTGSLYLVGEARAALGLDPA